jgi:hypothetical protein
MAIDKETETYQLVWKKAFRDGEITLRLKSQSDLTNVRFKLYNVASVAKRKPVGTDFELEDAIGNCSISADKAALTLRIYRKDKSLLLQSIAAQIGEELKPGDPAAEAVAPELSDMAKRLLQEQQKIDEAKDPERRFNYPLRRNQGGE